MRFKESDGDNVSVLVTSEPDYLTKRYNESTGIFSWKDNESGNNWIKLTAFDGKATVKQNYIRKCTKW